MSNVQEALKAAIAALEDAHEEHGVWYITAIDQCKAALSEIDKCEPVLYARKSDIDHILKLKGHSHHVVATQTHSGHGVYDCALFTSPQPREWVGLSDDDIRDVFRKLQWSANQVDFEDARAIEAKLKQLNTSM